MILKTEAIKRFLTEHAESDLSALYTPDMECQVNAAQDGGELVQGDFEGHHWQAWQNPNNPAEKIWKSFRIPHLANTEPKYDDTPQTWELEKHVEGVGLSGWDWVARVSRWVAFDFDAITGHSDKHDAKISEETLQQVKDAASAIEWVTVRRSTSGNGLHLYVFLDGVPTANHTEHAALARAILGKMAALTGFDFSTSVDAVGGNMWVWHRKISKSNGTGLKLLKQGGVLTEIPINWRDHIKVTSGQRRKNVPGFVQEREVDWFEDLCGQNTLIKLDSEHLALIDYLQESAALWWWDPDHHMLVCHTADLKAAHEHLKMRGIFYTNATGAARGMDQNCYMFPGRRGSWQVRRHTKGVQEHESWDQDTGGWTRTYLNQEPDLKTSARCNGGIEDGEGKQFVFVNAKDAAATLNITVPENMAHRPATIKPIKGGQLILKIKREAGDSMPGWLEKHGEWHKTLTASSVAQPEIENHDDLIRHLINESGDDAAWSLRSKAWQQEPIGHVQLALASLGLPAKEVLGSCIMRPWTLVNQPFQAEYPGDRKWNKNAAQLAFVPNPDQDNLNYGTWQAMLDHIGQSLDGEISANQWCKENGITNGGRYLFAWIASMFQEPLEPLPYLFLYGEQGTGKSILHTALSMLMTKGVALADRALLSQQGFNGELQSAVLCVIEETDLRQNKSQVYNRIKDWVTGQTISIHVKGVTPYSAPNSTHWLQCANEMEFCPVFPGDTRVTMILVHPLKTPMPRKELLLKLQAEAPDFLAAVMGFPIPKSSDRLNIPIIDTADKQQAQLMNEDEVMSFIRDNCFEASGESVLVGDFYDKFIDWVDESRRGMWSKPKVMRRCMVLGYPKGRLMRDSARWHIGNLSWTPMHPDAIKKPKFSLKEQELVQ